MNFNVRRILLVAALAVLAVGLLASLAANVILLRQVRQYYDEVNAARLDPYGLLAYADEDAPPPNPDARRVVFFGDSRALAWPAPDAPGYEFINRGIGAQTTAQVLGRLSEDLTPLAPDVVVLQVGINDLKALPLFPADAEAIVDRCEANVRAIVDAIRALGADVILTTIMPSGSVPLERRMFWSDAVAPAVVEVNSTLRDMAGPGVHVLDAYAAVA
ncbi:MAG: SGNH/GDSL hydrolase family protein, partial [Anaerolineae bacterium]|nr:SGNH/GDSL hydrolase family protein [Anaerolineae bacterium]